jgi:hypothetical protein
LTRSDGQYRSDDQCQQSSLCHGIQVASHWPIGKTEPTLYFNAPRFHGIKMFP